MSIQIAVFDGFDDLDVLGPFEVLRNAGLPVHLARLGAPGPVVSTNGLRIEVPAVLGPADGIVVPGGGWLDRAPEGAWAQAERGELTAALADLAARSGWVASVCTGAMLLARAGLLGDRYATTNRQALEELRPHVREVVRERVVDDGDRITAGGVTAGLDLGLHLVRRTSGSAAADAVAAEIEYEPQGRVWYAPPRA